MTIHVPPLYKNVVFDLFGVLLEWNNTALDTHEQPVVPDNVLAHIRLSSDMVPLKEGVAIFEEIKKRGFKTYALSNMEEEHFSRLAERYAFLKTFDGVVLSSHVGVNKPHPKIYQALLAKYNLEAHECFYIDDHAVNVDVAKSLGMEGCVYTTSIKVFHDLKRHSILPG